MTPAAKQITAAVAIALGVWALFGLLAGVIAAAVGLVIVLVVNREGRDTGAPQSRNGMPAAFPGTRAVWTCPGCQQLAGVLIPDGTPAGVQMATCGDCGHPVKVEVRDRECPRGHMIGAHGRCIHCGHTPQPASA